jgi:hypothetical protein
MLSLDHVRLMRGHLVAGLVLSLQQVYIVGKIYVRARSFNKVILVIKKRLQQAYVTSAPLHEVACKFSNGFLTLVSVGSLIANGILSS